LTEAIALGHDLGHTPFGHAGEAVLNEVYPLGFAHNEQSLRIVDELENGKGLNLTFEVRDGIVNHSKGQTDIFEAGRGGNPKTLEGEVVRISDSIAYINHDIDDAIRSKLITEADLPSGCVKVLGDKPSHRIDKMVGDVISNSHGGKIGMTPEILQATNFLRSYLYRDVYPRPEIQDSVNRAKKILKDIYHFLVENPKVFMGEVCPASSEEQVERLAADFVAGMTDRYALDFYKTHFISRLEV
jgi:dGTPase